MADFEKYRDNFFAEMTASARADFYQRRFSRTVLAFQELLSESYDLDSEIKAKGIPKLTENMLKAIPLGNMKDCHKTTKSTETILSYNVLAQGLNGMNGGFCMNFAPKAFLDTLDFCPEQEAGMHGGTEKTEAFKHIMDNEIESPTKMRFVRNPLAQCVWGERMDNPSRNSDFYEIGGLHARANYYDLLMSDIAAADADFVCLQEVDQPAFFKEEMGKCGYTEGVYLKKRGTAAGSVGGRDDGIYIFWKSNANYKHVKSVAVPMPKPGFDDKKAASRVSPVIKQGGHKWNAFTTEEKLPRTIKQVGLIVILQNGEDEKTQFAIVTNHLKSGKTAEDVYEKGFQGRYFAKVIQDHCGEIPTIQVGDMNTSPTTEVPTMNFYKEEWFNMDGEAGTKDTEPCRHCERMEKMSADGFEAVYNDTLGWSQVKTVDNKKMFFDSKGWKKVEKGVAIQNRKCLACGDTERVTCIEQYYGYFKGYENEEAGLMKAKVANYDFPTENLLAVYLDTMKGFYDALRRVFGDNYANEIITACKRRTGGSQLEKLGLTKEVIDLVFANNLIQIVGAREMRTPEACDSKDGTSQGAWPSYNHPSDHECVIVKFVRSYPVAWAINGDVTNADWTTYSAYDRDTRSSWYWFASDVLTAGVSWMTRKIVQRCCRSKVKEQYMLKFSLSSQGIKCDGRDYGEGNFDNADFQGIERNGERLRIKLNGEADKYIAINTISKYDKQGLYDMYESYSFANDEISNVLYDIYQRSYNMAEIAGSHVRRLMASRPMERLMTLINEQL